MMKRLMKLMLLTTVTTAVATSLAAQNSNLDKLGAFKVTGVA